MTQNPVTGLLQIAIEAGAAAHDLLAEAEAARAKYEKEAAAREERTIPPPPKVTIDWNAHTWPAEPANPRIAEFFELARNEQRSISLPTTPIKMPINPSTGPFVPLAQPSERDASDDRRLEEWLERASACEDGATSLPTTPVKMPVVWEKEESAPSPDTVIDHEALAEAPPKVAKVAGELFVVSHDYDDAPPEPNLDGEVIFGDLDDVVDNDDLGWCWPNGTLHETPPPYHLRPAHWPVDPSAPSFDARLCRWCETAPKLSPDDGESTPAPMTVDLFCHETGRHDETAGARGHLDLKVHDDYNEMYHVDNHLDQLEECEPALMIAGALGDNDAYVELHDEVVALRHEVADLKQAEQRDAALMEELEAGWQAGIKAGRKAGRKARGKGERALADALREELTPLFKQSSVEL